MRWQETELEAIDAWIVERGQDLTRAQAIRRLVEIGLTSPAPKQK
jgi:hypothetical protein